MSIKGNISKKKGLTSSLTAENLNYITEQFANTYFDTKQKRIMQDDTIYKATLMWAEIVGLLLGKVNKVDGKGLSTNDFTDEEKKKIADLQTGLTAANSAILLKASKEYVDNLLAFKLATSTFDAEKTEIINLINGKQPTLEFDESPKIGSEKMVKSGGIYNEIQVLNSDIETVASIAKGRMTGRKFNTVLELDAWLSNPSNVSKLVVGDNFYILAKDVPDYWWDGTQKQELETQKVDLTEYYPKSQTYSQAEVNAISINKQDKIITDAGNYFTTKTVESALQQLGADKADKLKAIPHTTKSGYPVTLNDHLVGENLLSCQVYSATGGVGDLVSSGTYTGKYAIPMKIDGKNILDVSKLSPVSGKTYGYIKLTESDEDLILSVKDKDTSVIFPAGFGFGFCYRGYDARFVDGGSSNAVSQIYVNNSRIQTTALNTAQGTKLKYLYFYPNNADIITKLKARFDIQVERGSVATIFESYVTPSTVTAYVDSPLTDGQYVSVSGLSTVNSAVNTITAETTVKPSNIITGYYQDINKIIANLQAQILGG